MCSGRLAGAAAGLAGRGVVAFVAGLVAACAMAAGAPAAVVTGVSDQQPAFFESPAYRALELDTVRLIVPWDAGLRAGPWDAWIERAERDGATVMVALEHDGASRCPASPCVLPPAPAYGDALAALLAKHPAIREVTPWNEPNHSSQPTFRHPDAAARYYEEARARCPSCTIVAGDFLDDVALPNWLSAYKAALTSAPAVWGLHNYYDSTYFRQRGIQTMLAQTGGRLWLTETGGIVSFRPPGGPGLAYDEQRAADGATWLYDLADQHPEIERMYFYQWQGTPDNSFDSGLLGYDGSPRPAYGVVAGRVGPRGGAVPGSGLEPGGAPAGAGRGGAGSASAGSASAGSIAGGPSGSPAALAGRGSLRPGRSVRLLPGGRLDVRVRCIVRLGAGAGAGAGVGAGPGAAAGGGAAAGPGAAAGGGAAAGPGAGAGPGAAAGGGAAGDARCRRRLVVRVAGAVVARLAVDVAASGMFARVVRLAPVARRHLIRARRPRLQLQTCAPRGLPCTARSAVAVSRVRRRT